LRITLRIKIRGILSPQNLKIAENVEKGGVRFFVVPSERAKRNDEESSRFEETAVFGLS
jgi:hypothetical protein